MPTRERQNKIYSTVCILENQHDPYSHSSIGRENIRIYLAFKTFSFSLLYRSWGMKIGIIKVKISLKPSKDKKPR